MPDMLTDETVFRAVQEAKPAIEALLASDFWIWGPRWVGIIVISPKGKRLYGNFIGSDQTWDPEWGEVVDFLVIARDKAQISHRTGLSSREVIQNCPFLLEEGDRLYAGSVIRQGLIVAVSGAKSEADEAIAEMILALIIGTCHIKIRNLKEQEISQL